jgi:AcrR family transcriptional regulator
MESVSLSSARSELVRQRVLAGVAQVLDRGEALTFAAVAPAAGVPERTIYRHFPTREALLAAVYTWVNQRLGVDGERPTDAEGLARLVRQAFGGFDAMAPVIRELLLAPEGRSARLAANPERQRAALAIVRHEAPGLDPASARRVAAVLQLLTAAATWQALREYWGLDGAEAAEASVLASELILEGARCRERAVRGAPQRRKKAARRAAEARS